MLEVEDNNKLNQKWTDLVDANMTTKMNYLWEISKASPKTAAIKALVWFFSGSFWLFFPV